MDTDLISLHLDIFGKHEKTTPLLSEYNLMLVAGIIEKDYLLFSIQIAAKLKVFNYDVINQEGFSEEKLKIKTDMLLDKIIGIIKRHNLFFGNDDEPVEFWLVHSVLCQVEAGIPYLITPTRQIIYELPSKMLKGLWRKLPELEQTLIMKNQAIIYKELGLFKLLEHKFESLDIFMKTYPFKTLPQPIMFDFRAYSVYEDVENYEKMASRRLRNI